ncbi:hypothetical protein MRB53_000563 [Persea americana]|uniref:Uncharacterized protein n=1 Tax=Persea americana TaxID=3435 RepID=A0ACC2MQ59_PERAE|nr:hypothetical protein MRB53_000563 [Persea americana]|eukprot:TRINITY_DN216_c0_g1_i1.p1 TRINITY_DN216_c0_g1~~TRINITY_DN216_c0_g1_i1.p1  ORF type:complete len:231 (-),score=51.38 TRINITY_DN216_c0_g1_i1:532-1224(-)
MDRVQILLLGLPIFLFCSDLLNLFSPPPPRPPPHSSRHHQHHHSPSTLIKQTADFPSQNQEPIGGDGVGFGHTIDISFCSSCSYRGTAVTMKKMLETYFPGIDVNLLNHPPTLPKRLLGKVVPVVQVGVIAIVMAGEHIFPRLGYMAPPPWYFSLRANRFGAIASTWLLGNVLQNFLQSSGAFEVYCDGDLVFSKLKEHRFPGEVELKDSITKKLANSRLVDGLGGGLWS